MTYKIFKKCFRISKFLSFVFVFFLIPLFTFEPVRSAEAQTRPAPVHLTIPNASVDTSVIPVGVTPAGNLDVPNNFVQVGWYKSGPLPGEMGSVVIDGHVDNGGRVAGPFKHLKDLKPGDDIYVTMPDGSILHYVTSSLDVYKTDKFPGNKVFNENDNRYLKLITCYGTFISNKNTYDRRLVITATLIGSSNLALK